MAQFDVHRNQGALRDSIPFVVQVQSAQFDAYRRRVVVPLVTVERAGGAMERLMPCLLVDDRQMVMDTAQIMGIPMRMLGKPVADLSNERGAIMAALDMLISGI